MSRTHTRITATATTAIALALVSAGCTTSADNDAAAAPTSTSTPVPSSTRDLPESASTTPTAPAESGTAFVDGEYQATGWYGGLPSHIDVTLTLENDVITAVSVTPTATNETSLNLQERFAEAIPAVVVGRPIADLEVDKIAGSSGTPIGFNDALDQIRDQATP